MHATNKTMIILADAYFKIYNVKQNNYIEAKGSATKINAAHPKHPEEEETTTNRKQIIKSKRFLSSPTEVIDPLQLTYK